MSSLRVIKPEIRILGVDDAPFIPHTKGKLTLIAVVFRGGYWIEGLIKTKITIDGLDVTNNLSLMIKKSMHFKQLQLVMLNGIMFGGFNVLDLNKLHLTTQLPIISIIRKKPNLSAIKKAMKNLPNFDKRWKIVNEAGEIFESPTKDNKSKIFFQTRGINKEDAHKIIRLTSTRSNLPEVLRVAHIVASVFEQPVK